MQSDAPQPKVLTICPSRGRPQQCARMIESFNKTAKISALRICLDMDDPCLDEYMNICNKASILIDTRKTITKILNDQWQFADQCFKFFSCTNDDFIYHTDGWDLKLVNQIAINKGMGIAYGNDLYGGVQIPTTSVISREIVQALGWLQLPGLTHLFGDMVWKIIGEKAKCLHYCSDVSIEHLHFFNHKADADEIYERTNSPAMYRADQDALEYWIINQSRQDVEKVKGLLCQLK